MQIVVRVKLAVWKAKLLKRIQNIAHAETPKNAVKKDKCVVNLMTQIQTVVIHHKNVALEIQNLQILYAVQNVRKGKHGETMICVLVIL